MKTSLNNAPARYGVSWLLIPTRRSTKFWEATKEKEAKAFHPHHAKSTNPRNAPSALRKTMINRRKSKQVQAHRYDITLYLYLGPKKPIRP